jgi:hypothetical protein
MPPADYEAAMAELTEPGESCMARLLREFGSNSLNDR